MNTEKFIKIDASQVKLFVVELNSIKNYYNSNVYPNIDRNKQKEYLLICMNILKAKVSLNGFISQSDMDYFVDKLKNCFFFKYKEQYKQDIYDKIDKAIVDCFVYKPNDFVRQELDLADGFQW
jgi:hypothetical protein